MQNWQIKGPVHVGNTYLKIKINYMGVSQKSDERIIVPNCSEGEKITPLHTDIVDSTNLFFTIHLSHNETTKNITHPSIFRWSCSGLVLMLTSATVS